MILASPVAGKEKSRMLCDAFKEGAPKSNVFAYVFYGVNESNMRDFQIARNSGQDWYYIDNSYFDKVRGQQFRITKNRFQVNTQSTRVIEWGRFDALGIPVRPWRGPNEGAYLLVIEQSPSFMLDLMADPDWLSRMVEQYKHRAPGGRLVVRPWMRDKLKAQTTIVSDLQGAALVVAHSSAAAVTAITQGVPVVVSPVSALYGMHHEEREHVLNVLACSQWTIDEIRSGKAWAWLNRN